MNLSRSLWYASLASILLVAASMCAFLGHDHWWLAAGASAAFGTKV